MIEHTLRFLQHQDIYTKKIKTIRSMDAHLTQLETSEGLWAACDNPVDKPERFTKIFMGFAVDDRKSIVAAARATKELQVARILIFSKEGRKLTHIIPHQLKDCKDAQLVRVVEDILTNASE